MCQRGTITGGDYGEGGEKRYGKWSMVADGKEDRDYRNGICVVSRGRDKPLSKRRQGKGPGTLAEATDGGLVKRRPYHTEDIPGRAAGAPLAVIPFKEDEGEHAWQRWKRESERACTEFNGIARSR